MTTLQSLEIIDLLKEEILSFQFVMWPQVIHSQRVMWHHGWVSIIISYHLARFCGHRPCWIGDILFSIGHTTSQDHVIKEVVWHPGWVSNQPCKKEHFDSRLKSLRQTLNCKKDNRAEEYCLNDKWHSRTAGLRWTTGAVTDGAWLYPLNFIFLQSVRTIFICVTRLCYLYQHSFEFRINITRM